MNFNYLKGSATLKVIIINVICFILTAAGTIYSTTFGNNYYLTISNGQIYRLVTCMFYHYGIMHILCNMYSLSNIGLAVENRYGKKKFWIAYFVTGIVGGLIACIIHNMLGHNVLSAGASGAICGLLGLLIGDMGGTFNDKLRATINTIWPLILIGLLGSGIDNICHFTCLGVGVALSAFYRKR